MSEPTVAPAQPAQPPAPAPDALVIPTAPPGAPAAPPPSNDPAGVWAGDVTPAPGITTVPAPTEPVQPDAPGNGQPFIEVGGQRYYTQEFLERARSEERDKMHGRLQTIEQEMQAQREQREQREREIAEQAAQEAAEAERTRLEGLPIEQRVQELQQSWEQRWQQRNEQDAAREALEAQERRFNEVQNYRAKRVGEESDLIHPTLRDLVTGNTEEEVERSITDLKARTDAIVGTMREATVAQRQAMPGVAPTGAPPVGPMDQTSGYQSITSADIAAMDPATYAKNRPALMEALRRKTQTEGLYGA